MFGGSEWVILVVVAALVAQDTTAGPQLMFSEPLVAGALTGWVLGDVELGLLIGIAVQLIWSGAVPAGTALFLDVSVGTVCAVAAAFSAGGSNVSAIAALIWMVPVGLFGCGMTTLGMRVCEIVVAGVDPDTVTPRGLVLRHAAGWFYAGVRGAVTFALGAGTGFLVVPFISRVLGSVADPTVLWGGIMGAGAGAAMAVTWQFSRGKAAGFGALGAVGALLAGVGFSG